MFVSHWYDYLFTIFFSFCGVENNFRCSICRVCPNWAFRKLLQLFDTYSTLQREMGMLALTFPIILFPPWTSVQCRASCTLLVGRRMTILLACLKYDWSSNTRHSEILMSDWGVQMELLPAECYEHRHTSAPIIHAPSPLTETHSLRAVCVCVRIRLEVLKNSHTTVNQ